MWAEAGTPDERKPRSVILSVVLNFILRIVLSVSLCTPRRLVTLTVASLLLT